MPWKSKFRDTGHGLTDEIRERLFLPFYSTKHRGTGLGLSIAAKIVQEVGGSIRAESNSPKGARFLLRLPLMEPGEQPSHERQHGNTTYGDALMNHILVVDDEGGDSNLARRDSERRRLWRWLQRPLRLRHWC